MFWVVLFILYIFTLPINASLLGNVWYRRYPRETYQPLGTNVPELVTTQAQLTAIKLFGIFQPMLAGIPLIYGEKWYHFIICAFASVAYSSSGSAQHFVDRVRSSNLMFVATLFFWAVSVALIRFVLRL